MIWVRSSGISPSILIHFMFSVILGLKLACLNHESIKFVNSLMESIFDQHRKLNKKFQKSCLKVKLSNYK